MKRSSVCTLHATTGSSERRQVSIRTFFAAAAHPAKRRRVTLSPSRRTGHADASSTATGVTHPSLANNNSKKQQTTHSTTSSTKKSKFEQMYLDLGQRDFASQHVCQTCGMLYVHGVAEDLQQHAKICQEYLYGVPFVRREAARVVATFPKTGTSKKSAGSTGCIVEIRPTDSYSLRKKVEQVQHIVIKDLGFAHSPTTATTKSSSSPPRTVFLYIVNQRVVGLVVAEVIDRAYPVTAMSSSSSSNSNASSRGGAGYQRSSQPDKAVLGIYQLWVHLQFRQQGIATRLVTAARDKMVFGYVVPLERTAFSSPTQSGLAFARQYMGADRPVRVYDTGP